MCVAQQWVEPIELPRRRIAKKEGEMPTKHCVTAEWNGTVASQPEHLPSPPPSSILPSHPPTHHHHTHQNHHHTPTHLPSSLSPSHPTPPHPPPPRPPLPPTPTHHPPIRVGHTSTARHVQAPRVTNCVGRSCISKLSAVTSRGFLVPTVLRRLRRCTASSSVEAPTLSRHRALLAARRARRDEAQLPQTGDGLQENIGGVLPWIMDHCAAHSSHSKRCIISQPVLGKVDGRDGCLCGVPLVVLFCS